MCFQRQEEAVTPYVEATFARSMPRRHLQESLGFADGVGVSVEPDPPNVLEVVAIEEGPLVRRPTRLAPVYLALRHAPGVRPVGVDHPNGPAAALTPGLVCDEAAVRRPAWVLAGLRLERPGA